MTRTTDPSLYEMRQLLDGTDEFDREEAIYWYASDNHGGQSSLLYRALSQSEFKPGPMRCGPCDNVLYNELVGEFGGIPLSND